MPEIISRKEARERGLKFYFTGKPCKWGHIVPLKVSSSTCLICNRKNQKNYNNRHREKRRETERNTPSNTPERRRVYRKIWTERWKERYPEKHLLSLEKKKEHNREYKQNGPRNPKDEMQWLRKSRALLRGLKRALKPRRREASTSSQTET